jgi:hypothetical protein
MAHGGSFACCCRWPRVPKVFSIRLSSIQRLQNVLTLTTQPQVHFTSASILVTRRSQLSGRIAHVLLELVAKLVDGPVEIGIVDVVHERAE